MCKMTGDANEGDQQDDIQERLQALLDHASNKICADCPERGPGLISLLQKPLVENGSNLGVFCCSKCSRAHRKLGDDVCVVKRVYDDFTLDEVQILEQSGNQFVNNVLETNATDADKAADRESFIRKKYKDMSFFSEDALYQQTAVRAKANKYAMLLVKPAAAPSRSDRLLKRAGSNPNLLAEEGTLSRVGSSRNLMGSRAGSSRNLTANATLSRVGSSRNLMGSRAGSSRNLMANATFSRAGSTRNLLDDNECRRSSMPSATPDATYDSDGPHESRRSSLPSQNKRQQPTVRSIADGGDSTVRVRGRMTMGRAGSKRDLMASQRSSSRRNVLGENSSSPRRDLLAGGRSSSRRDLLASGKSLSKRDLPSSCKPSSSSPSLSSLACPGGSKGGLVKSNLVNEDKRNALFLSCSANDTDSELEDTEKATQNSNHHKKEQQAISRPSSTGHLSPRNENTSATKKVSGKWNLLKSSLNSEDKRRSLLLAYNNGDDTDSDSEDGQKSVPTTTRSNSPKPKPRADRAVSPKRDVAGRRENGKSLSRSSSRGDLMESEKERPRSRSPKRPSNWNLVKSSPLDQNKKTSLLQNDSSSNDDESENEEARRKRKIPSRSSSIIMREMREEKHLSRSSSKGELSKGSNHLSRSSSKGELSKGSNHLSSSVSKGELSKGSKHLSRSSSRGDLSKGSNHVSMRPSKNSKEERHQSRSSSSGDLKEQASRTPQKQGKQMSLSSSPSTANITVVKDTEKGATSPQGEVLVVEPISKEQLIKEICEDPENQVCSECNNKGPTWASFFTSPVDGRQLGVLCCYFCYGLHHTVGEGEMTLKNVREVHQWSQRDIETLTLSGNTMINASYEATAGNAKEDQYNHEQGREAYFFEKYINLRYFSGDVYQHLSARAMARALETKVARLRLEASLQQQESSANTDIIMKDTDDANARKSSPRSLAACGKEEGRTNRRSSNERDGRKASSSRNSVERDDERSRKKREEAKRKEQAILELKAARKLLEKQEAKDDEELRKESSSSRLDKIDRPESRRSSSKRNLFEGERPMRKSSSRRSLFEDDDDDDEREKPRRKSSSKRDLLQKRDSRRLTKRGSSRRNLLEDD